MKVMELNLQDALALMSGEKDIADFLPQAVDIKNEKDIKKDIKDYLDKQKGTTRPTFDQNVIGETATTIVGEQKFKDFLADDAFIRKLAELAGTSVDPLSLIRNSREIFSMMQVCVSVGAAYERAYGSK